VTFKEIPIRRIRVTENIRSDPDGELGGLMETIDRHGMLQPIVVVPRQGWYEVVSGHRRLEAMKARNEATVPCIIRDDLRERDLPAIKLIENVQRKQLSSHELVDIFEQMKAATPVLTLGAIGRMVGKSPTWVALKYRAAKIYNNLIDQGVPEEAVMELTDTELQRLARVADPTERKGIVGRPRKDRKIGEAVKKASSFVPPKPQLRCDSADCIGFTIFMLGRRSLQVLCADDGTYRAVSRVLNQLAYERSRLYIRGKEALKKRGLTRSEEEATA